MKNSRLESVDKIFTDFIRTLAETIQLVNLSAKGIFQLYSVGEIVDNYIQEIGQNEDTDSLKGKIWGHHTSFYSHWGKGRFLTFASKTQPC